MACSLPRRYSCTIDILLLVVISDGKANVTMNSLGAIKEAREEVLTLHPRK